MAFECVIDRTFSTAPEGVFEAWTNPALFARWAWAGIGANTRAEIDARAGGTFWAGTDVKGETWAFRGVYTEVDAPARLAGTLVWEADVGYEPGDEPFEVVLTPAEEGCTMRFVHGGIPDEKSVGGHHAGWSKAFDDLARALG